MARESKFLKLYLPDRSDNYDVERDQNDNFLKLDAAAEQAQKMATDLFSKKQDKEDDKLATNDKTVVGAINENQGYTDGLAGLQGENSFPLSQATEGQVYKEPNSKKYYVCLRSYSGGQISVPNENFEELSVWKNRDNALNKGFLWEKGGTTLKSKGIRRTYSDSNISKFQVLKKGVFVVTFCGEGEPGIDGTVYIRDGNTEKILLQIDIDPLSYSSGQVIIEREKTQLIKVDGLKLVQPYSRSITIMEI